MIRFLEQAKDRLARLHVARRTVLDIAPSARVNFRGMRDQPPSTLSIGEGTIFEGRIVSDRVGSAVSIGRDSFIGGSTLVCATRIEIGSDVLVSWGCTIVDHDSHAVDWAHRRDDVKQWYRGTKDWSHVAAAPVRIGNKCWLGFNVIVLKGVTLGEGVVVGAGSVVTRDVVPYTLVAGSPARVIREVPRGP